MVPLGMFSSENILFQAMTNPAVKAICLFCFSFSRAGAKQLLGSNKQTV